LPDRSLLEAVSARADGLRESVVADRRVLHSHPELGWCETETTRFAAERLRSLGYSVRTGDAFLGDAPRLGLPEGAPGNTGLVAELSGTSEGPVVILRVDIDALPITEADRDHRPATDGWSSRNPGVMHACGHDGHLAIGLAVAEVVASFTGRLHGKFRLIAQPAEEGTRGARAVLDAGWVADADLMLAFHIGLGVPSGTLAVGVSDFLATRKYRVVFDGRGAHAGIEPETGRNALVAACQAVLGLQALAQSSRAGVRINVGTMTSGVALNVVPARAELGFELRASEQSVLEEIDRRARILVEMVAAAHEVNATVSLVGEAASWSNGARVVDWAQAAGQMTGAFQYIEKSHSFGASDDATLLLRAVAAQGGNAGYFILGANLASGHHTPTFDFDEGVLSAGGNFLSLLVCSALLSG
jgi:aminobenzoyl-glutamate utilization protein A